MEPNKKLIIIDFCGTLTDIQTGDLFIYFIIKKYLLRKILFFFIKFFQFFLTSLNKYLFFNFRTSKSWFIFLLSGISLKEIQFETLNFSTFILNKHIRKDVLNFIITNYSDYYKIILSAGYFDYIDHINNFLKFDEVYASKLINQTNIPYKYNYKIDRSFYGSDKLNFFLNYEKRFGPFNDVVFLTDSKSDFPLANYCKTIFCYPNNQVRAQIKKNNKWSEFNSINI